MSKKQKVKILKKIRRNLNDGSGLYSSCRNAGIDYSTLWHWRDRSPRIQNYITRLLKQKVQLVEDALYKNALGGNTTAQIFFLKNRGDNWSDGPVVDQSQHNNMFIKVYRPEKYSKDSIEDKRKVFNLENKGNN